MRLDRLWRKVCRWPLLSWTSKCATIATHSLDVIESSSGIVLGGIVLGDTTLLRDIVSERCQAVFDGCRSPINKWASKVSLTSIARRSTEFWELNNLQTRRYANHCGSTIQVSRPALRMMGPVNSMQATVPGE